MNNHQLFEHTPHVRVSNDRSQVIDVRCLRTGFRRHVEAFIVVLLVVKLLGSEQAFDLVRNSSVRVVPGIRLS